MATEQLSQNGGARDVIPEDGSDRGRNYGDAGKLAGARGRTEWRRLNLPKRSKSLDWRGGEASPGEWRRTGVLRFSGNLGGSTLKRAESLESRGAGESKVLSRVKAFNSAGPGEMMSPVGGSGSGCSPGERVSPVGLGCVVLALERASGGQSLPTRLRSSPGSGIREPASGSVGSSRGQSIWDRIQKLYGTTGPDEAANRDKGGKKERGNMVLTNTVDKKSGSREDSEKETVRMGNTAQEKEKRTDVEGKRHEKKEAEKRGRENTEVSLPQHSQSVTRTRDSQPITTPGVGVTTGSNSRLTNQLNGKTDTYDRSKTPARDVTREGSLSEDVFEANTPERIHLQNTENTKLPGKLVAPSTASVRNKIHQFEALTQTSQVPVPNYLKPRRAFSVPEQLSEAREAVRKSGSDRQGKLDIPLNGKTTRDTLRDFSIDEPDLPKHTVTPQDWSRRGTNTKTTTVTAKDTSSSQLSNCNNNSNEVLGAPDQSRRLHSRDSPNLPSPVSDDDKTPTTPPRTTPELPLPPPSPFHPQNTSPHLPTTSLQPKHQQGVDSGLAALKHPPVSTHTAQGRVTTDPDIPVSHSGLGRDSLSLPLSLPLLPTLARWNSEEGGWSDEEDTDDEGTEKDEDSNYDSDSAESSVTITSTMSQSHRRSFSLSLAELCNFGEVDYDPQSSSDSEDDELDRLLDDVKGLGDTTLQNYEDVQVVVLHKEVGVGLGFTMAGGVDQNKPVIVHKVFPAGVAAEEGSIQEGDKVLSINGTALCGSSHWEVLRTLRRARTQGMGVVVLRRGGVTDPCKGGTVTDSRGGTQTEPTNTGQRVCVRLEKRSRDLGFSLEGGVGSSLGDKPLTVQKLFLGGPVNQVSPGDEVLEIEGVSLVGLRRLEAWTLIRTLPPGPVDVVLHRPHKPQ
ncbi:hypothetical protein J4Q44_G00025290 [Coregonus suidteri]|uniref:PDZ domain-containing protein n=1 Tax=Coregonus suidteri TaxID=861788 RepID=A0AAN8R8F7_9TELE